MTDTGVLGIAVAALGGAAVGVERQRSGHGYLSGVSILQSLVRLIRQNAIK